MGESDLLVALVREKARDVYRRAAAGVGLRPRHVRRAHPQFSRPKARSGAGINSGSWVSLVRSLSQRHPPIEPIRMLGSVVDVGVR